MKSYILVRPRTIELPELTAEVELRTLVSPGGEPLAERVYVVRVTHHRVIDTTWRETLSEVRRAARLEVLRRSLAHHLASPPSPTNTRCIELYQDLIARNS